MTENRNRKIILIVHNVRSCHNVGSLLRTAEGLGVETVYLTGYTPHPMNDKDKRLPHIALKVHKQIQKTALGAEKLVYWEQRDDPMSLIAELRRQDYEIMALEQAHGSVKLNEWKPNPKIAIIIGRETEGIEVDIIKICDKTVEIPMFGKKESFNVVQAAAIALYHCRFS